MTNNRVNFTERQDRGGWAKYLPAISGFYTTQLGYDLADENFTPKSRIPAKFEFGVQGINFLKKEESYFYYGYGLYSAGHAERNLAKCDKRAPMIHDRDRSTTVLIGDSGGFQVATGIIKLDWATVKGPEGDKLREEILRYLEYTSDWSMTLDVPAFAATPAFTPKTGLTKFSDTLDITLHNLDYFVKNRIPGKTKFLNVLSGSDPGNANEWYDAVKHFSMPGSISAMGYTEDRTLEGFAFAGVNMRNMSVTLERILKLRQDNLLHDKDWIHFLGVGRLDWACFLTSIERQLKKHDNKNINISFDAASPFVSTGGYGLCYDYNHFNSQRLTYSMSKGLDNKSLKGSTAAMPYQGPIMERLTVGDICVLGPNDPNKNGKIGTTSWDTLTYEMVMAHNVHNHIEAVQEINRLADIEYLIKDIDYLDWYYLRNKKKVTPKSDFVPDIVLFFNDFVTKLLDPANPDPFGMLVDNRVFLDFLSFGDKSNTQFTNLWHSDTIPSVEDMADANDVNLTRLEDEN